MQTSLELYLHDLKQVLQLHGDFTCINFLFKSPFSIKSYQNYFDQHLSDLAIKGIID